MESRIPEGITLLTSDFQPRVGDGWLLTKREDGLLDTTQVRVLWWDGDARVILLEKVS